MSRWIAGICVVVLVGAGIAVVQVPAAAGDSWLTILWATWIIAVVWALTRPSFSLLFAAIMTAMLLFVIIPATNAQLFGLTTIGRNDYRAGVVRALEIAALAQCGMLAGAVAARTFWPVPRLIKVVPQLSPSRLDGAARRAVLVGVLALLALSVLGGASLRSFFVYATSGGYGSFAKETTGYFGYLASVQCVAGLTLVLLPLRLGCHSSSRRGALFYAALAAFVLLGDGQRARFFVPVFAAGLIWLKTSKSSHPPQRRLAAIGVLVVVLLGGLIGVARGAAHSRHVSVATVLAASAGSANDLFLPLAGLASAVPGQFPYLGGTSYLEVATFLVPRALWNGKPQGAISTLTTAIDPGNSGLAVPEFGEMYANFGMPGVVIGSLLLGMLVELLSRRFARSTSIGESVFTAVCGAVLLDLFARGDIAPLLTAFAGLLVATALVCRRRSTVLAAVPAPALVEHLESGTTRGPVGTQ
jgi:oligosaccharide repeat unit polymerase